MLVMFKTSIKIEVNIIHMQKNVWDNVMLQLPCKFGKSHTMDMLWEKFQWILPLYVKLINSQSKASVVCSVTTAVFMDFYLKKLNGFS